MYQARVRRSRRRRSVIIAVAVLVIALGAAAGSYLLLRTTGSPDQTAASYLSAWQRGSYPAMEKVSVNVPRSGLAGPLRQASAELGIRHIRLSLGRVTTAGGSAQAQFTATAALGSGPTWRYQPRRPRRRDRGPLPRGARKARADEHRHAGPAGRVPGRLFRGHGQAG